jgi:hypothetical protein
MINNYTHIGFLPGNSLQSTELNELQERFYLNQTLDNNFLANWLIFSEDYSSITGTTDPYIGPFNQKIIPLNPNQIQASLTDSIEITMKSGWYKLTEHHTGQINLWTYLEEDKKAYLPITSIGTYGFGVIVEFKEIECTNNENDEGYQFNSNVADFIEPWIQGSNRFKLSITDFQIIYEIEATPNLIRIGNIKKGIDTIPNGTILVQYNNNYKINNIVIS